MPPLQSTEGESKKMPRLPVYLRPPPHATVTLSAVQTLLTPLRDATVTLTMAAAAGLCRLWALGPPALPMCRRDTTPTAPPPAPEDGGRQSEVGDGEEAFRFLVDCLYGAVGEQRLCVSAFLHFPSHCFEGTVQQSRVMKQRERPWRDGEIER